MKKYGLNELKFVFYITDEWDDGVKTMESEPMTLGELIDGEDIDFTDGSGLPWKDIDWATVKIKVSIMGERKRTASPFLIIPPSLYDQLKSMGYSMRHYRKAKYIGENIPKGFDNEGNYKGY